MLGRENIFYIFNKYKTRNGHV